MYFNILFCAKMAIFFFDFRLLRQNFETLRWVINKLMHLFRFWLTWGLLEKLLEQLLVNWRLGFPVEQFGEGRVCFRLTGLSVVHNLGRSVKSGEQLGLY